MKKILLMLSSFLLITSPTLNLNLSTKTNLNLINKNLNQNENNKNILAKLKAWHDTLNAKQDAKAKKRLFKFNEYYNNYKKNK